MQRLLFRMASERGGMMSDLISRKSISDYLKEQHAQVIVEKHKDGFITDDVCKGMECSIDAFVNFISQCPTVDAKPVVHGEWIFGKNHGEFVEAECSHCKGLLLVKWYDEIDKYRFCPKCGADMRKKVQE